MSVWSLSCLNHGEYKLLSVRPRIFLFAHNRADQTPYPWLDCTGLPYLGLVPRQVWNDGLIRDRLEPLPPDELTGVGILVLMVLHERPIFTQEKCFPESA